MGLDYDYRIYIKKKNLKNTLKYVFSKCEKNRSGFEFQEDKLIKVNRFPKRIERTEINNYGLNQDLDCCLIFENDEKIWEYHLNNLCETYHPNSDDEGDFIGLYQVDENNFWIGNIEIRINDYNEKINDTVELKFFAVTTDMSILFTKSKSIEKFFQRMCKEVEADYGCLCKESEGYRLIWYEGEYCSYDVSHWNTFNEFDFIPVVKRIMKNKKRKL